MAASVNKVILIGNLGRDPETRFTNSGTSVTNFSIATKESFADKSGTRQDRTDWHNIIVWGKQGETCAQYLKKGSPVYIEGRISYREYEAKDRSGSPFSASPWATWAILSSAARRSTTSARRPERMDEHLPARCQSAYARPSLT